MQRREVVCCRQPEYPVEIDFAFEIDVEYAGRTDRFGHGKQYVYEITVVPSDANFLDFIQDNSRVGLSMCLYRLQGDARSAGRPLSRRTAEGAVANAAAREHAERYFHLLT